MSDAIKLNHKQIVRLLKASASSADNPDGSTIFIRGHMGSGKTSLLKALAKQVDAVPVYLDGSLLADTGDLSVPRVVTIGEGKNKLDVLTSVPREDMGLHYGKPVLLMWDEVDKTPRPVAQALARLMNEGVFAGRALPQGSIRFMTGNLQAEGVSSSPVLGHMNNRVTHVEMAALDAERWISDFAIPNGIAEEIIAWTHPSGGAAQVFTDFRNVPDPKQNLFIYHPKDATRTAFTTGRSLERASHWIKRCREGQIGLDERDAALAGTIGAPAAAELGKFILMAEALPRYADVIKHPDKTPLPPLAAQSMLVAKVLQMNDAKSIGPWIQYLSRMDDGVQAFYFVQAFSSASDVYKSALTSNPTFSKWVASHGYLFGAN